MHAVSVVAVGFPLWPLGPVAFCLSVFGLNLEALLWVTHVHFGDRAF